MAIDIKKAINKALSPEYISALKDATDTADKHKVKIFLIGGIVRDLFLNLPIKDIDIAVQGDAVKFADILNKEKGCKIISIQEDLKTAKVEFKNKTVIDFASTRCEQYNSSGQLPTAFDFGCELSQDVKRRDFSINTLAVQLSKKENYKLIDYYLGQFDIEAKKIRVLHYRSFNDDPSRIIRALKFKKRFNFNYENQTYFLMQLYLNNVESNIPLSRIKDELKQYFKINKKNIYSELINTNAYKLITKSPIKEINENLLKDLSKYRLYNKENKWFIYFSLLLLEQKNIPQKLNLTSEEKEIISDVKVLLSTKKTKNNYDIYKMFYDKHNLALCIYYLISEDKSVLIYLENLKNIKVKINGKDLLKLNIKPSKHFGEIFEQVLKERIKGKINTKSDEIKYVKNLIKKV